MRDKGKGETQTGYLLALYMDLLPPELYPKALSYLIDDIKSRDWHLSTGFVGCGYLNPVLTDMGYPDVAYRLLLNDTFPSWGYSIKQGATTIWERWDGWTENKGFQDPGMNSFAHYSFGAVYQWMVENIGGIRTDGPAYKNIVLAPQPGGKLTSAATVYHSIRGPIGTNWKLRNGELSLRVAIPPNTSAMVSIPAKTVADVTEGNRGIDQAKGVRFLRMEGDRAIVAIEPGQYHFVSKSAAR